MRVDRLREDDLLLPLGQAFREQHRFAQGRRAVVQRRVRDVERREEALVRLVLEDRLQRPLRNLGLIRRVRGEELRAQQQLVDARRLIVRVRAAAEEGDVVGGGLVARGQTAEPAARLDLRPGAGDVEQFLQLHVRGDGVEQPFDVVHADDGEHLADVLTGVRDVAMRGGGSCGVRQGHSESDSGLRIEN
jgi:hypothetical protein